MAVRRANHLTKQMVLFELVYLLFYQERGTDRKAAVEDLNILGEHMRCMKEEQFYKKKG